MGLLQSVKNWVSYDDEEFDDEILDSEEFEEEEISEPVSKHSFGKKNKIVSFPQNNGNKIVIMKPSSFDSAKEIAEELKARKSVIIDVGSLEADVARRIIDFVSGTICGVNGNIQRVSGGVFIAVPSNVDVLGQVKSDFSISKGYTF